MARVVACSFVNGESACMRACKLVPKEKKGKKFSKMHAGRKREGSTIRPGGWWWFLKRSLLEAREKKKSFDSRQQTADSQTVSENGA